MTRWVWSGVHWSRQALSVLPCQEMGDAHICPSGHRNNQTDALSSPSVPSQGCVGEEETEAWEGQVNDPRSLLQGDVRGAGSTNPGLRLKADRHHAAPTDWPLHSPQPLEQQDPTDQMPIPKLQSVRPAAL